MTIPSPSAVHFRDGRDAVPPRSTRHGRLLLRLGPDLPQAVRAFADAAAATCSSTRST